MYKFNNEQIKFDKVINVTEIKIESIVDFTEFLLDNNNFEGFIFRGHSEISYNLLPTILRNIKFIFNSHRVSMINDALQNFRQSLRGRIELPSDIWNDNLEIWAVGQHFGLKTPLLDWTASPWIALFFAFEHYNNSGNDRALFMLNASKLQYLFESTVNKEYAKINNGESFFRSDEPVLAGHDLFINAYDIATRELNNDLIPDPIKKSAKSIYRYCRNIFPLLFSPKSGYNNRLVNQRGLFTVSYEHPIDMSLKICVDKGWVNSTDPLLIKITFPDSLKELIIEYLYEMNISRLSLFPDVDGAASYVNWKYDRKFTKLFPGTEEATSSSSI